MGKLLGVLFEVAEDHRIDHPSGVTNATRIGPPPCLTVLRQD
jgi:hypothetical protein